MGMYINPRDRTKEVWLTQNATPLQAKPAQHHDKVADTVVVCLMDNGMFSAAGVAFSQGELEAFSYSDDHRPKRWFSVDVSSIEAVTGKPRAEWLK